MDSYQGQGRAAGSFTLGTPFGPGVINPIYTLSSVMNWNSGVDQVKITDLNSNKAIAQFKKQLRAVDFRYYYLHNESRNRSLITLLLIDTVRIDRDLFKYLLEQSRVACATGDIQYATSSDAFPKQCKFISHYVRECGTGPASISAQGSRALRNFSTGYTGVFCKDTHLRMAAYVLQTLGFNIHGDETKAVKDAASTKPKGNPQAGDAKPGGNGEGGKPGTNAAAETPDPPVGAATGFVNFANPAVRKAVGRFNAQPGGPAMDIIFRSPESLVRFLGELIKSQTHEPRLPWPPTFLDLECGDEGEEVPFFTVLHGRLDTGRSAVAVRDPEGEYFYIPVPERKRICGDRTLETLAIVADVVNSATSQAEITQPNFSVRISP